MGGVCSSAAATAVAKTAGSDREAQLRKCFQALDKDRSGFIYLSELRLFLQQSGIELTKLDGKAKGMMERLDANADGKVSMEEFVPTVFMLTAERSEAEFAELVATVCKPAQAPASGGGSLPQVILSDAPADEEQ